MSGLLSGVLPAVFSAGNKLKRQIGGLLSDPVGTVQQQVGLLNDKAGAFNQLTAQAAQEHVNSLKTGGGMGQSQMKLANTLADSYNPMGMVVWHGSPHKFSKFDSSKIGTGEGAQAYGHGLYLAESPDVAKNYQVALGRPDSAGLKKSEDIAAWAYSQGIDGVNPVDVLTEEIARLEHYGKFVKRLNRADYDEALQILQKGQAPSNGSLYKVDLPDEAIAKMLDWDKPLSQQAPEVLSMLQKSRNKTVKNALAKMNEPGAYSGELMDGAGLIRLLSMNTTGRQISPQASQAIQKAGIPGIRYLDGGSRGAGAGTSNFVIFPGNEGLLTILERNGQPLK